MCSKQHRTCDKRKKAPHEKVGNFQLVWGVQRTVTLHIEHFLAEQKA